MAVYLASAAIDASPEHVWGILTSASGYQEWNPEIIAITGTMSSGARIVARVKLGGGALRLPGPIGRSVGDRQPEVDNFASALKARAERVR